MNAPDKIYRTTTYLDNDRGKAVYKEMPVKGAENIEYIRKDALLEWAKETKEIMSLGGHVSIDDIISKIELL